MRKVLKILASIASSLLTAVLGVLLVLLPLAISRREAGATVLGTKLASGEISGTGQDCPYLLVELQGLAVEPDDLVVDVTDQRGGQEDLSSALA